SSRRFSRDRDSSSASAGLRSHNVTAHSLRSASKIEQPVPMAPPPRTVTLRNIFFRSCVFAGLLREIGRSALRDRRFKRFRQNRCHRFCLSDWTPTLSSRQSLRSVASDRWKKHAVSVWRAEWSVVELLARLSLRSIEMQEVVLTPDVPSVAPFVDRR